MLQLKKFMALFIFTFATFALIVGCVTTASQAPKEAADLNRALDMKQPDRQRTKRANAIRRKAIEDTALSLGARTALAWKGRRINRVLKSEANKLDQIFDFNRLLLSHNVLPPVLEEGDNTLNLSSTRALRLSDKIYKILAQARFVTAPPTWRNYLWQSEKTPEMPDHTLLPKNDTEERDWKKFIHKGWAMGLQQANGNFSMNTGRLVRDFRGMALYRELLAKRMVSAPFVSKAEFGVTGDKDQLDINDRILRITALPELQTNAKKWQPAVRTKHE